MDRKVPSKLIGLMSCALTLGGPMVISGVVNADNPQPIKTVQVANQKTTINFDANDALTKATLEEIDQGKIKDVKLIVVNDQKHPKTINMDDHYNGLYSTTLNGDQSKTKYQFAIEFDNGKTYKMNNPYAKNDDHQPYSVIEDSNLATNKNATTNITITMPNGTVVNINGSATTDGKKTDASVHQDTSKDSSTSSVKTDSSSKSSELGKSSVPPHAAVVNGDNKTAASSSAKADNHSEQQKYNNNVTNNSAKSSSITSNSNENHAPVVQGANENHQQDKSDNHGQAPVQQNNNDRTNNNGPADNGGQTDDDNQAPVKQSQDATPKSNQDKENHAAVMAKQNAEPNSKQKATGGLNSSSQPSSQSSSSADSSSITTSTEDGSMPQTGEKIIRGIAAIGVCLLSGVGGYYGYQWYQKKHE